MATVTHVLSTFANKAVRVELDYDDVTWSAFTIRVINGTAQDVFVEATRDSDGLTRSRTFPPGTATFALPTGVAQRFVFTRQDRIDGYWEFGGLTFRCAYPGV